MGWCHKIKTVAIAISANLCTKDHESTHVVHSLQKAMPPTTRPTAVGFCLAETIRSDPPPPAAKKIDFWGWSSYNKSIKELQKKWLAK